MLLGLAPAAQGCGRRQTRGPGRQLIVDLTVEGLGTAILERPHGRPATLGLHAVVGVDSTSPPAPTAAEQAASRRRRWPNGGTGSSPTG